jgi:threonine dehydratase
VTSLVSADEIRAAAARLAGVTVRTPLVPFPGADPPLLLKPESLQPTGSFKLRGAYAAISALPAAVRARGVIAHSRGSRCCRAAISSRRCWQTSLPAGARRALVARLRAPRVAAAGP